MDFRAGQRVRCRHLSGAWRTWPRWGLFPRALAGPAQGAVVTVEGVTFFDEAPGEMFLLLAERPGRRGRQTAYLARFFVALEDEEMARLRGIAAAPQRMKALT